MDGVFSPVHIHFPEGLVQADLQRCSKHARLKAMDEKGDAKR